MTQYTRGSVTVTQNNSAVVGTDTHWYSSIKTGDEFKVKGLNFSHTIQSIVSDTELTLSEPWAHETLIDCDYQIVRDFTANYNLREIYAGDENWPFFLTKNLRIIDNLLKQISEGVGTTRNRIETWYQNSDPCNGWPETVWMDHTGDLWWRPVLNTEGKEIAHDLLKWLGSEWSEPLCDQQTLNAYINAAAADNKAVAAHAAAATAQNTADGKIESWFQPTDPKDNWPESSWLVHQGDMWWNTHKNELRRWTGSDWTDPLTDQTAIDAAIAASAAQITADGKIESWFQTFDPALGWPDEATRLKHTNDLWWNTDLKELRSWTGTSWTEPMTDQATLDAKDLAMNAKILAENTQALIDNKIDIWIQQSDPALAWNDEDKVAHSGDMWWKASIDGSSHELFRWNSMQWIAVQDKAAINAMAAAAAAQGTADNKIESWFQPNDPSETENWTGDELLTHKGDMWWNTDLNELRRWLGIVWTEPLTDQTAINALTAAAVADAKAAAAQETADNIAALADGKINNWIQQNDPSLAWTTDEEKSSNTNDMWWHLNADGSTAVLKRWTGTEWEIIKDQTAITALANAATAQGTADGKIETWFQNTDPAETWPVETKINHKGDLWWHTVLNTMRRWTGTGWSAPLIDQAALNAVAAAATADAKAVTAAANAASALENSDTAISNATTSAAAAADASLAATAANDKAIAANATAAAANAKAATAAAAAAAADGKSDTANQAAADAAAAAVAANNAAAAANTKAATAASAAAAANTRAVAAKEIADSAYALADKKIETWFQSDRPDITNNWSDAEKLSHKKDMWWNSTAKTLTTWEGTKWSLPLTDAATIAAAAAAATAKGTADKKIETWFQTNNPYTENSWNAQEKIDHTGDMWWHTANKTFQRWNGTSWSAPLTDQATLNAAAAAAAADAKAVTAAANAASALENSDTAISNATTSAAAAADASLAATAANDKAIAANAAAAAADAKAATAAAAAAAADGKSDTANQAAADAAAAAVAANNAAAAADTKAATAASAAAAANTRAVAAKEIADSAYALADKKIETWFQSDRPDITNNWSDAEKLSHKKDMWWNSTAKTLTVWQGSHWSLPLTDQTAIDAAAAAATAQDTADGKIETWFQNDNPYTENSWNAQEKIDHKGDMWWHTANKTLQRWNGTGWSDPLTDQATLDANAAAVAAAAKAAAAKAAADAAAAAAAAAATAADKKSKVFFTTPAPPYKQGDLWSTGSAGELKVCKVNKATGSYVATDWGPASNADNTQEKINAGLAIDNAKVNGKTLIQNGYINTDVVKVNSTLIIGNIDYNNIDNGPPAGATDNSDWAHKDDASLFDGGKIHAGSSITIGDFSNKHCVIDSGDLEFYQKYDGVVQKTKSLKRIEVGEVVSGKKEIINGYFEKSPALLLSLKSMPVYDYTLTGQNQTLNISHTPVTETSTGSNRYQFTPVCELVAARLLSYNPISAIFYEPYVEIEVPHSVPILTENKTTNWIMDNNLSSGTLSVRIKGDMDIVITNKPSIHIYDWIDVVITVTVRVDNESIDHPGTAVSKTFGFRSTIDYTYERGVTIDVPLSNATKFRVEIEMDTQGGDYYYGFLSYKIEATSYTIRRESSSVPQTGVLSYIAIGE